MAKRTRTQVLKVCTKGHPLKMRKSTFMRISAETGQLVSGEPMKCWGCKNPIKVQRGYYRCSYMGCDYDVGMNCGLVADLEWDDYEEPPIDDTKTCGNARPETSKMDTMLGALENRINRTEPEPAAQP